MKKLTTIFAAVAMFISTSAFAYSGEKVNDAVKTAFERNFSGAQNVTWQKTDEFYFAHFELNKDDIAVAYNEQGLLVGTSHIISRDQLPEAVAKSLKENYGEYQVSLSVTEINLDGEISYYLTADSKRNTLRLKSSADGNIEVEKRTKKKVLVGRVY